MQGLRRQGVGSSLLSALRNARSTQVKVGRGLWRRSTATSWRNARISPFGDVGSTEQGQPAQHAAECQYTSRIAKISDHAWQPATRGRAVGRL